MIMDLHIHSKYSYDSLSNPSQIIKKATKKGLDVISITDHDTMKAYDHIEKKFGISVIPGMEVKTNKGDIIGLFLSDEIYSRSFMDVIDDIRDQGGIIVLPHPFRRNCDPEELIEHVDLVEVLNSRSTRSENDLASKLCESYSKREISGSDAHTFCEIGRSFTKFEGYSNNLDDLRNILLKSPRFCTGNCSSYYLSHCYSFAIGRLKKLVR
ncbi:putative metal-dependent phosphoesterase TrpH [Methanomicrobium sp. W14]|uniref:PHP domain-containing protein n=1 Tax=Methanomicrobium sp. W14 TaxID=2817839 RepID=UPI001AE943EE|nr:PHP domain-containing protein [Methanomicrobium sp. W14]MBP2133114.1 putative metal-dependent phosphoesterase TrpH [Methanomicrobium sp. W14]